MDDRLIKECTEHIRCDTARISKICGKMYLIIGFNKNTKDDTGTQIANEDNERVDYDYVRESVVASGHTEDELINSAKEYGELSNMSWEQYFDKCKSKLK